MKEEEKGVSTGSLVLLFLLGVVVCAVFFSLGFLLGYRERSSSNPAEVERVIPTGEAPPALNPPPAREDTTVRQDANPVPAAAQPVETGLHHKDGGVASGTRVSAEDRGSVATAAAEATPSAGGHESFDAQVPAPTRQTATGRGALQVAALQNRQDAEALLRVLKQRGYPVFIVSPEGARANDALFRVRVGPFASRDQEEKTRQELQTEGFKPFVKR
jgi:cell division protein FtsN